MNERLRYIAFVSVIGVAMSAWSAGGDAKAAAAEAGGTKPMPDSAYVFSFFRAPNGEAGLCLAYSTDLFNWTELQGPFHKAKIGDDGRGGKVMRDPFVAPDPGGGFRMVWTTGWGRKDIGYARSQDLVTWTDEKLIAVMKDRPAANCWAPKLFFDAEEKQWLVIWSTTLRDNTFPPPADRGTSRNHRIWYVTTKDFDSFSGAKVLFDPGHSCIDAYLFRDGADYCLFFKDERSNDSDEFNPQHQNIRMARGKSPYGPFGNISSPITGGGRGKWHNEGPSAIKIGGTCYVFYDHHHGPHYFGATASDDLKTWHDVSDKFSFPPGCKHGHVFRAPAAVVKNVRRRTATPDGR